MKSDVLHRIGLGVAALCSLVSIDSALADIRIYAAGGIGKITPKVEAGETETVFSGAEGKLAAHFDVFSPVPGFSLYAGPEFRVGSFTSEETNENVVIKSTLSSTLAGVEAGANFGMIPLVTLQAGYNYSFPMSGSIEVKNPTETVTKKSSSGSESGFTLRGLITPFPLTRLGLEYSLGSGKNKYSEIETELKFDFWAARAVFGVAL